MNFLQVYQWQCVVTVCLYEVRKRRTSHGISLTKTGLSNLATLAYYLLDEITELLFLGNHISSLNPCLNDDSRSEKSPLKTRE